jgi:hypothetical protein
MDRAWLACAPQIRHGRAEAVRVQQSLVAAEMREAIQAVQRRQRLVMERQQKASGVGPF